MLYYDSETETFWSQMTGEAVVGPWTGKALGWIATTMTTWKEWRAAHPATTVLSPPHPARFYETEPYKQYRATQKLWFPIGPDAVDARYKAKDLVTIVTRGGKPRCYPHAALKEGVNPDGALRVVKSGASVRVEDAEGRQLPSIQSYWFAWGSFYKGGTVFGE